MTVQILTPHMTSPAMARVGNVTGLRARIAPLIAGLDETVPLAGPRDRRLIRAPLFASVAIVTLAAGIGANSALFGMFNSLLWQPLPLELPCRMELLLLLSGSAIFIPSLVHYQFLIRIISRKSELNSTLPLKNSNANKIT